MEYLNFDEISKRVKFGQVLDWLQIPYTETQTGEYKGQAFIINKLKNVYFNPVGHDKGSVINFVSALKGIDLRTAAKLLKDQFLATKTQEEPKRPIPTLELEYHPFLAQICPEDVCKGLKVGFCKQKSIMSGRICFKVGEHYIGYSLEKEDWLFPKGFKRDTLWNIENCDKDIIFITKDPLVALLMIAHGYHNTASIMGTKPTVEQDEIVSRFRVALSDF